MLLVSRLEHKMYSSFRVTLKSLNVGEVARYSRSFTCIPPNCHIGKLDPKLTYSIDTAFRNNQWKTALLVTATQSSVDSLYRKYWTCLTDACLILSLNNQYEVRSIPSSVQAFNLLYCLLFSISVRNLFRNKDPFKGKNYINHSTTNMVLPVISI